MGDFGLNILNLNLIKNKTPNAKARTRKRRDQADARSNDEDLQDHSNVEKWQRVESLGQTFKSHRPPKDGTTLHGEESGDSAGDPTRLEGQHFQATCSEVRT